MKFTLLGTGTSNGVPVLGCDCEVCRSDNLKDKRMRCALLVESDEHRVLVDCGPDIRMQLMPQTFRPIDAVLLPTYITIMWVALTTCDLIAALETSTFMATSTP